MSRLVSRDPFARQEIHRETIAARAGGCAWCGNLAGNKRLFAYRVESDGGRRSDIRGAFCSISCMRSYHS